MDGWTVSSPVQKDSGILMDEKQYTSWQCTLAAQQANHIWDCKTRSVASGAEGGDAPPLLLSPENPTWKYCMQLCGPRNKSVDLPERVQRRPQK